MMDLMYFGDSFESDSYKLECEFKDEVKDKFNNVELRNAYDDIKGYRQEVHLPEEQKDSYLTWLIGKGWLEMSLTMQLLMMDKEEKAEFERIWKLAKQNYPEAFKKSAIGNEA